MKKPFLHLLIGLPGSGKSTFAKKLQQQSTSIYLSSDEIRGELYGDPSIQGNPAEVFALMQERAVAALKEGQDVIYDATNLTRKNRKSIIVLAKPYAIIQATVVWASIDTCIGRDANRERKVGAGVIDTMVRRFEFPYYDEGIDIIAIHYNDTPLDQYEVINQMLLPHDNPHHSKDSIFAHCSRMRTYLKRIGCSDDICMAALFHDCGKPYTAAYLNKKGNPCLYAHYYNHENVGAWIACGMQGLSKETLWLISSHMASFNNKKYYESESLAGTQWKKDLDLLHDADINFA